MASHTDETRGHVTCAVDVSSDVVDAAAGMTLEARVSCSPVSDLRGHTLLIRDEAGAAVASAELTEFDGETSETGEFVVDAPVAAGAHTWVAVCPAVVKDGISYGEASTPISFTVTPHATHVVAWDMPSAIVAGDRFTMKVGIKCSSSCQFTNREFGVYDHAGAQVGRGTLQGDVWPGTAALYVAEVELVAPAAEGLYTWVVKSQGSDEGIPHAEGSVSFGVRVVGRPEYVVTIETVDQLSQAPLSGARVVMHPYKAVTDERGMAEVRVAKGAYKLFVSQTNYLTFGLPVEVTADMSARAELHLEPVTERN
jgi:hypothetical protein